jgi:hypothetical protein
VETTRADLRKSTVEDRSQRSDERAGRAVGVSGRAVQQAKTVERDAPDLAATLTRFTDLADLAALTDGGTSR